MQVKSLWLDRFWFKVAVLGPHQSTNSLGVSLRRRSLVLCMSNPTFITFLSSRTRPCPLISRAYPHMLRTVTFFELSGLAL